MGFIKKKNISPKEFKFMSSNEKHFMIMIQYCDK